MNIKDYLLKLSEDEDALQKHTEDPETAARSAGLNDEEVTALVSADREKIATLVENNLVAGFPKIKVNVKLDVQVTS